MDGVRQNARMVDVRPGYPVRDRRRLPWWLVVGYFLVFFAALGLGGILFLLGGVTIVLIPGSLPMWAEVGYVLLGIAGSVTIAVLTTTGAFRVALRRYETAPSTGAADRSGSVPTARPGQAGTGPAGSGPARSGPAGSGPAGTGSGPAAGTPGGTRNWARLLAWLAGIAGTVLASVLSAALTTVVTRWFAR